MTLRAVVRQSPVVSRVGRMWATGALALLATCPIGGCAGIANPYQTSRGTKGRTAVPTSSPSTPADAADPPAERGGTIAASARRVQNKLLRGAAGGSLEAALERYAELYVNWTAANVARRQRELASVSLGSARAQALQAAASAADDTELLKSRVANSGTVVAITRGRGPAAGDWVLVTREQTSGQGDYAGLPPTLHVIYAELTETSRGWVVTRWQPEN